MAAQVERLTGFVAECELCTFNEAGELCDRRVAKVAQIEAKIPKDVRDWLLGMIPAKPKEG